MTAWNNPNVTDVKPEPDYILHLWFENGEQGLYDMKPWLDEGIFRDLRDPAMFNSVSPFMGTVQWDNYADVSPDVLYEDSIKISA
jgi:hypothetical protein